jgi:hypothetical protein
MNRRGTTLGELLVVIAILAILCAILTKGTGCGCGEGYSEGDRTGTIVKCSYKGLMSSTKSWEVDMNLGGMVPSGEKGGGFVANVWHFTVEDEEVLKKVQEAQKNQRPVTIHYVEWLSKPGCRSETGYFAKSCEYVDPPKPEKK